MFILKKKKSIADQFVVVKYRSETYCWTKKSKQGRLRDRRVLFFFLADWDLKLTSPDVDHKYTCMYLCIYVCMYVCMLCMYVMYVCMYVMYVCMYVMYVCMYMCRGEDFANDTTVFPTKPLCYWLNLYVTNSQVRILPTWKILWSPLLGSLDLHLDFLIHWFLSDGLVEVNKALCSEVDESLYYIGRHTVSWSQFKCRSRRYVRGSLWTSLRESVYQTYTLRKTYRLQTPVHV